MEIRIPGFTMGMMVVTAVLGIIIPAALYIYLRKKKHAEHLPFWIGGAVFVLFAMVLERAAQFGFSRLSGWADIQGNLFLYAVIGGLFAGLFEETGRLTAFTTVLKKKRGSDDTALMYGAGHGGIEAVLVLSLTMVNNLVFSLMANSGNTASLSAGGVDVTQILRELATISPWMFLVGAAERCSAVALHVSLSVLVWFAVKNKRQRFLYPAAVLIHAGVNAVAVLLAGTGMHVLLVELAVYALTGLSIWAAAIVWKKNRGGEASAEQPREDPLAPVS
jgi:uncharacterized membrane protein YhfC